MTASAAKWIRGTPPLAKDETLPVYLWNGEYECIAEAYVVGGRVMANYIDCEGGDWWQPDWWYCPIAPAPPLPDEARTATAPPKADPVPEGGHCTCCIPSNSCCTSIVCRNRGVGVVWTGIRRLRSGVAGEDDRSRSGGRRSVVCLPATALGSVSRRDGYRADSATRRVVQTFVRHPSGGLTRRPFSSLTYRCRPA